MTARDAARAARAARDERPDDELTPELRRAVAALRRLPSASPGAVARVTTAVRAAGAARRARVRRWSTAGALAAAAAGVAVFVGRERGAPSPDSVRSSGGRAGGVPGVPTPIVPAAGGAGAGAYPPAAFSDAERPVTFVLRRPDARAVTVVGDFNRWDPRATPLARRADGGWVATVPLAPGRHAYRFVVDDSLRVLDPRAPAERDQELGVARSIVVVGAP